MTLIQVEEWRTDRVIGRLVACDCDAVLEQTGKPGFCGTRFLLATLPGAHEDRWVAAAALPAEMTDVAVGRLLDEEDRELPRRLEKSLALAGVPWPVLTEEAAAAKLQFDAICALPEWMTRLPCGLLWETRRCVFGSWLTRVPRALFAMHAFVVPEGPHRLQGYAQDERWSEPVVEGPVTEWRS